LPRRDVDQVGAETRIVASTGFGVQTCRLAQVEQQWWQDVGAPCGLRPRDDAARVLGNLVARLPQPSWHGRREVNSVFAGAACHLDDSPFGWKKAPQHVQDWLSIASAGGSAATSRVLRQRAPRVYGWLHGPDVGVGARVCKCRKVGWSAFGVKLHTRAPFPREHGRLFDLDWWQSQHVGFFADGVARVKESRRQLPRALD